MDGLNVNVLTTGAGIILSLSFEYIPGAHQAYGKLDSVQKRGLMALLVGAFSVLLFGLSCVNSPFTAVSCDQGGAWALLEAMFFALVANQTTHRLAKRSNA